MHSKLWIDVSSAIESFFDDLREHEAGENVIMMLFTEFVVGCMTTGRGPTTVLVEWPSSSETG